jgi:hopene-associated glycosyltransferase HpnB
MTLIGFISVALWVYLLFGRGDFWRSTPVLSYRAASGAAKVAVVIPARDEADSIAPALNSLLAQTYKGPLSIILVDDNSTDGTGTIAGTIAAADPRLEVITGAPLEPGWSGKLWAVAQGLKHPKAIEADYVLLTDADIVHAPEHLDQLVAKAEASRLDLVSEMVALHCETFAERALIPAFVFFFQSLYPFARANDPGNKLAAAAGGTMLVSQTALQRIDGVERIRNCLIDDCALAKEIKQVGPIWLGHATAAKSLRIYEGPQEIWAMIARTAYVQLNRSPALLLGCVLAMGVTYIMPPILTFMGGWATVTGVIAWAAMAFAFQPTLRRYRQSPLWGLALPLIGLFYIAATIDSALQHYRGRGGGWKNRTYGEEQEPPLPSQGDLFKAEPTL